MTELMDLTLDARDYLGEGLIAFPELGEQFEVRGEMTQRERVLSAQGTLRSLFEAGEIEIYTGLVFGTPEPSQVFGREARRAVDNEAFYVYGDEDETRAWFLLE